MVKSPRGRYKYIPSIVVEELEDIKMEDDILSDAEAFRKMAKHARIGREVERIAKFRFDWKPAKKKRGLF